MVDGTIVDDIQKFHLSEGYARIETSRAGSQANQSLLLGKTFLTP
jgi:hypothetical protein